MSDFDTRLKEALRTIEPGPAPVATAIARGRKLRARRRIAAAGGVAVVAVAVAAGYPALAHKAALPAPAPVTRHERITVSPPGHDAPKGLIASGTIGGKPWAVSVSKPGSDLAGPGQQCIYGSGAALRAGAAESCITLQPPGKLTEPVQFQGASDGNVWLSFGAVRPDVDHVTVKLADDTLLTLRPVDLYGTRYVAFPSPIGETIATVTAYSRSGEIAVAIPFMDPGGMPTVAAWLRPGEFVHARATGTILSRTTPGVSITVTAYEGPWGTCFVPVPGNGDGGGCWSVEPLRGTTVLGGPVGVAFYGSAAPDVSYLMVTLTGGGSVRVSPVTVGDERLWAVQLRAGQTTKRWIAYDASGHKVASGDS